MIEFLFTIVGIEFKVQFYAGEGFIACVNVIGVAFKGEMDQ